jgi:small subunit ribosomal protein S20
MPVIKSSAKKMRVDERRRAHNLSLKTRMRTAIKKAESSKKFVDVSEAYSVIDRAVKANLIHKNLAAREKASLSKLAKPVKFIVEKPKSVKKAAKKAAKKTKSSKTKSPKKVSK